VEGDFSDDFEKMEVYLMRDATNQWVAEEYKQRRFVKHVVIPELEAYAIKNNINRDHWHNMGHRHEGYLSLRGLVALVHDVVTDTKDPIEWYPPIGA
jgi:hypothetical protein